MASELEERIARLEEHVENITKRLGMIEESLRVLGISGEIIMTAARLVTAFSKPVIVALESARRVAELTSIVEGDVISRAIIEALSSCEPLSISEVTRKVRVLRGKASRRIISSRIERLSEKGIIVWIGEKKPKVTLKQCLKEKSS